MKNPKSKIQNLKSQKGFTLLELMIVMFIIIILVTIAMPQYYKTVQHAKETVLQDNLFQMRKMIRQYEADKGKLPKTLDDIVEAGYIREKPIDPMTEKAEWYEVLGEDPNSTEDEQGMVDVKSLSEEESLDGKPYKEY